MAKVQILRLCLLKIGNRIRRKLSVFYLFKNDAFRVRSASEGIGLPPGAQVSLFVVEIGPPLNSAILDVLTGGPNTSGFTHFKLEKFQINQNIQKQSGKGFLFSKVLII